MRACLAAPRVSFTGLTLPMRKCIVIGISGCSFSVGQPAQTAMSASPVQSMTCRAAMRVSPSLLATMTAAIRPALTSTSQARL